jgi:hypothetical protein
MDKNLAFFSNCKILFFYSTYIYAGYGSFLNRNPDIKTTSDLVPYGIKIQTFSPIISTQKIFDAKCPWEKGYIAAYHTVLQDGEKLKLYYEVFRDINHLSDHDAVFCYAESLDGINWIRPNLGLIEFNRSKENNILLSPEVNPLNVGIHGSNVFIDPSCSPDQRYKLTYCGPKGLFYAGYSADGIHWTLTTEPIINAEADSQNIVYWDGNLQKYVGYFRLWCNERRGITRAETDDFWHWPDPERIFHSDPAQNVDVDYYTNGFHIWPGTELTNDAFLMFPAIYHRSVDEINTEIYVSRTGKQWFRPNQTPITFPGVNPYEMKGALYFGKGIWSKKPGIFQMSCSYYPFSHNAEIPFDLKQQMNVGGFYSVTFREDGFVGLTAETCGEFYTVKFQTDAKQILINALTSESGWIHIGLYDTLRKTEIETYTIEEGDLLHGDLLWVPLKWHGNSDLSDYNDVPMRLHIKLFRANIFGLKFA